MKKMTDRAKRSKEIQKFVNTIASRRELLLAIMNGIEKEDRNGEFNIHLNGYIIRMKQQ